MDLHEREKRLTLLYSSGALLSLVTIICTAVPWHHWEEILDTCLSARCGCILYGTQSFRTFNGGKISTCYFTTVASIPAFLTAIIVAVYHGYRVCMYSSDADNATARMTRRNGDVAVVTPRMKRVAQNPGCICLTVLVFLSCAIGILLTVNASILTHGYYSTCREYRQGLSKNTQITGQMAAVINVRLSCGAIFDFMDYIEPVTRPFQRKEYINYNRPHEERDYERGPFINTGLSLQVAVSAAWANCVVWIAIFISNSIIVFKERGWCGQTD